MCCEKPLALNLAQAERLIAASHGGVLMENFSYHLTEGYQSLQSAATAIESTMIESVGAHFAFEATGDHRSRYLPELAGGSFLDLGCYGVDFVHRLLNSEVEVVDVAPSSPAAERKAWGSAPG